MGHHATSNHIPHYKPAKRFNPKGTWKHQYTRHSNCGVQSVVRANSSRDWESLSPRETDTMDSTSQSNSSPLKTPLCKHNTTSNVYISRSKKNPGKSFVCCPYWKVDDYGYWRWLEDENVEEESMKSTVIEIEKLKEEMDIERKKINETKKDLKMEMEHLQALIVDIKVEMQVVKNRVKELEGKMSGFGCCAILVIVVVAVVFVLKMS
ncbi:uncharacterized protein LOC127791812 [Diospyros lotus]|uniref:uncharacterized protein LOC127791812 n=1 Tax=Diospyros lotus TaxID=55363 RepID=UPI00225BC95B|nr:uncharacterized protein LOC127791812 [Diospyros lotus]XP_052177870.1 uncharacterized protein LOC127791812 [Diospyros lotus]